MVGTAILIGLAMSLAAGALVLGSLAHNPRIWLGDFPREMREAATPLTAAERRLRLIWGIPMLSAMVLIVPIVTWILHQRDPLTYGEAFATMWIAWMVFNVVDLVIIDWLTVVFWRPRWTVIEEIEHLYHLNTYGHHFRAFLIGTAIITAASALFACMVWL